MKITLDTYALKRCLTKVEKAISTTKLSETQHLIYFAPNKKQPTDLTITAFNGESMVQSTIKSVEPITSLKESIAVEGKLFCEFIKKIQSDTVDLTLTNNELLVKTKSASIKFSVQKLETPNILFDTTAITQIDLNATDFLSALSSVGYATAKDDSRPMLKGINLSSTENILFFVALDGYRLAKKDLTYDTQINFNFGNITIPISMVGILSAILNSTDSTNDKMSLFINENKSKAQIIIDNTIFVFSLFNGDFINYKQIIPTSHLVSAEFNVAEMKTAIDTTQIVNTNNQNNAIKIFVTNKNITFTSKNEITECETNIEPLNIQGLENGDTKILALNSKYLIECLKNIKSGTAVLNITQPTNPITIETETTLGLILPIRLIE